MTRFGDAWRLHQAWGGFGECAIELPLWGEGFWNRLTWLWTAWQTVGKQAKCGCPAEDGESHLQSCPASCPVGEPGSLLGKPDSTMKSDNPEVPK